jgi:DNA-binding transcriptional MerR regulator/methylmalonyl-CoA mutase cobalamin-binding subunit
MLPTTLTISAVERETQLSKDVLRAWERRYGFPAPERDANGERCYSIDQVERLRLMKRLIDHGYRPGNLAPLSAEQLAALPRRFACPAADPNAAATNSAHGGDQDADAIEQLLTTVKDDPAGFPGAMRHHLARGGLERFIKHIAAPLTAAVGERWVEGSFDIFNEHLYTEETTRVLRQAIAALPGPGAGAGHAPRILLTSLPGESHGLGLLMAEALLALDGAACMSLGTETPLLEIVRAAAVYRSDIVALSFSMAYPRRQIAALLRQLRQALPAATSLWAGGAGIATQTPLDGVRLLTTLDAGREALAQWRAGHGG